MKTEPQQSPMILPLEPQAPQNPGVRSVWKLRDRPDRPSPYGVQWRTDAGKPKLFFPTAALRDEKFAALAKALRSAPAEDALTARERSAWRAFRTATEGTPWQDVVAGWRNDLARTGRSSFDKTVSAGAAEFLHAAQARFDRGEITRGYHTHIKQKTALFADSFGATRLDAVGSSDIAEWIDDLGFEANGTFNTYRKIIRALFEHFKPAVKNPCDDVPTRSEAVDHVGILTVAQTTHLFHYAHAHHRSALGRLALEAFAGLRFSSAFRLEEKDLNFEDRGILLPAHKLKTGRRHYIDGLPDNLWAWLGETDAGCWAMVSSEWMHLKSRLFAEAEVPHPRNCLRHSFCTYHVAAHKNPGLTATILCHRNQQKLWEAYNGVAKQSEGRAYFEISPPR